MHSDVSDGVTVAATRRCAWARPGIFAASLVIAFGLVPTAMAEGDAGVHTFFQDQVRQMQAAAARQPVYGVHVAAPLTIRRSVPRQVVHAPSRRAPSYVASRRPASAPRVASAAPLTIHPSAKPTSAAPASVFEDRTLRRGDVVILSEGPRVFAGSQQFPYADKDFVAVRSVPGVAKSFRRDLEAIANNPYQHM